MTFKEALIIAKDKEKMIGSVRNGARLDEILIAPTNPRELEKFKIAYITNLNAQASIIPFVQSDVEIYGVYDKFRIRQDNCLILLAL